MADFVLSFLLLFVSLPVLLVVGLAVWLDSPGPVIYRQARVGKGGRAFTLLKLRSMMDNAEADTGPVWSSSDDPRQTRVGRFLRRTHLDELPQLWNVLRGEMSLVGPRPERPEFVERLAADHPGYAERHTVKPGMTGLAQVRGMNGADHLEERLEFDREYVRRACLTLDTGILARTLARLVTGRL